MAISTSTGTYKQIYISEPPNRERESYTLGSKTVYTYDARFRNEDPTVLIKWCRKNFGERGVGWDFTCSKQLISLEIWDSKYKVIYELWKH
jgi:hypothetical protein